MSNELAERNGVVPGGFDLAELGLSLADLLPAGVERLQPEDTGRPPRLRLSQPNRPIESVEPGRWVNTSTGEVYDSLEVVVLAFLNDTRVLWPPRFSADNVPLCVSDNGRMPAFREPDSRRATEPRPGPCTTCPEANWQGNTPPRCQRQRNFLLAVVTKGGAEPVLLTLQSTALVPAKQLTQLARMYGLRRTIRMGARLVSDPRGQWYLPIFSAGARLSPEQVLALVELKRELGGLLVTADIGTEEPETETEVTVEAGAAPF